MEGADEALGLAAAVPARELNAAVAAGIVKRLDAVLRVHHDHRLVEVLILNPVANLGNLLQPARHLPDLRKKILLVNLRAIPLTALLLKR